MLSWKRALDDLRWTISSPSLLCDSDCAVRGASSGIETLSAVIPADVKELISALPNAGERLTEFLNRNPVIPVGRYFERLFEFYLRNILQLNVIDVGKQIQTDGRTIGELDFVFEDLDGVLCHAETAVKFYLHLNREHRTGSQFIGPNPVDNFENKTERLFSHQIPLSWTHYPDVQRRIVHVKGIIFYRPDGGPSRSLPECMSPQHTRGTWIRSSEVEAFVSQLSDQSRIQIREKPFWLSKTSLPISDANSLLSLTETVSMLTKHFAASDRPRMLSLLETTAERYEESQRIMVVDDHWPDN